MTSSTSARLIAPRRPMRAPSACRSSLPSSALANFTRMTCGSTPCIPGWAETPGVRRWVPVFRVLTYPLLCTPGQGADTFVWLVSAEAPGRCTGRFWHDRRIRPTHYTRRTRETPDARQALWDACQRLAEPGPRRAERASRLDAGDRAAPPEVDVPIATAQPGLSACVRGRALRVVLACGARPVAHRLVRLSPSGAHPLRQAADRGIRSRRGPAGVPGA